jgi:hypothetical protein
VSSIPVVSMFISVVLTGAKNTAFWDSLTDVDVGTALGCLWRYLKYTSSVSLFHGSRRPLTSRSFIHYTTLFCLCTHSQDGLQLIQCYRVHAVKSAKKRLPI